MTSNLIDIDSLIGDDNNNNNSNSNINNNNSLDLFKQNTFRRFGIEVYCKNNNNNSNRKDTLIDTKGYRLSVLPFFFKNRVNFLPRSQQQQSSSPIRTTNHIPVPPSYNASEDAGIPTQLNQPIFDILSKSKYISTQTHENLCEFIAAEPSQKHHVISEDYDLSLSSMMKDGPLTSEQIGSFSYQILKGLVHLHQNRITHRNLSTENIKLDSNRNIKLSNYSLYYLSNQGENVAFPIGNLCNLSPESILSDRDLKGSSNPKCDVWSLGCIILEMAFGHCLWYDKDPSVVLNRLLYLSNLPSNQTYNIKTQQFELINNGTVVADNTKSNSTISKILENQSNMKRFLRNAPSPGLDCLPDLLVQFINCCLTVNSETRPSSAELLEHPYFDAIRKVDRYAPVYVERPAVKSLELPDDLEANAESILNDTGSQDRDIFSGAEIYYLWRLAGGDIERELVAQGLANPSPSVHKLPLFVPLVKSGTTTASSSPTMSNSLGDLLTVASTPKESSSQQPNNNKTTKFGDYKAVLYNSKTCVLSIDRIVERIRQAYGIRNELLEADNIGGDGYLFGSGTSSKQSGVAGSSQRTPDQELEYQIARLAAFHDALYNDALEKFNITPLSTTISKSVSNIDDELWWMKEVPMEKKKQELFPRMGIHDLINNPNSKILDIRPSKQFQQCHYPNSVNINYIHTATPANQQQNPHQMHLGTLQQASSVAQQQVATTTQQKPPKPFNPAILEQYRGHPIVVIAGRGDEGVDFCNQLVRWKFPFVALLNGGMDALEHGAQTLLITNES
ncbi:RabGAP/TBC domain-containing protein [Heterostelium album PN500]|uniref:RabGAP/TBC domain-containing protein n=1 Tax=Heterostelium pallidum (strain ATCC 26659 / Pp 5 / PN500) TaxID=670386 RepID=D3BUK6_HETP5|nr:RabGAP/TBC domain-containing protein [Heterostelium album PN500]EFA74794.1 RabGAP/TBC domain-containing protein [Heterostelium album PN500]|eukprot:XP_020426928.1 RabGAP/TBC domain-containing protein [Heterostelium album PN500]